MILALAIILVVFLGLSIIVLIGAFCALCLGLYDEIYEDLGSQETF